LKKEKNILFLVSNHEFILFFILNLGPLILFITAMIIIYIIGTKKNKALLEIMESEIEKSLDEHSDIIKKVQIRQDEFEFRCEPKNKDIRILTFHLKMANRSFIIQKILNLIFKEKERVFMGVRLRSKDNKDDNPQYKFDIVPYLKKSFIKQRYETFVKYDDIIVGNSKIDEHFMIKSENKIYVAHFTDNVEMFRLLNKLKSYIEHLGLQKAKEDTDPHISLTFEFNSDKSIPIMDFVKLFFIVVNLHLQNHDEVKKLIKKHLTDRGYNIKRGKAKRGAAK